MMMFKQLTLFALPWLGICGRITAIENLELFIVRHYKTICLQISSQAHAYMLAEDFFPHCHTDEPNPSDLRSMWWWQRLILAWEGDNEMCYGRCWAEMDWQTQHWNTAKWRFISLIYITTYFGMHDACARLCLKFLLSYVREKTFPLPLLQFPSHVSMHTHVVLYKGSPREVV